MNCLRAEWTKLRTLPGTGWLLLGVVAATVTISATVSASLSCTPAAACQASSSIFFSASAVCVPWG